MAKKYKHERVYQETSTNLNSKVKKLNTKLKKYGNKKEDNKN